MFPILVCYGIFFKGDVVRINIQVLDSNKVLLDPQFSF